MTNKTFGGKDEYKNIIERKLNLSQKENNRNKLNLLNYLQKEQKHKEIYNNILQRQKYLLEQKSIKRKQKIEKVENKLLSQRLMHQRSMNKLKEKLLEDPFENSSLGSNDSEALKRAKELIRIENVKLNKERAKRQLDYK